MVSGDPGAARKNGKKWGQTLRAVQNGGGNLFNSDAFNRKDRSTTHIRAGIFINGNDNKRTCWIKGLGYSGGGRIGELVIWNRVLTEREVQDGVFGRGGRNLELSMRSMLEDRLVWGELHIFSVVRLTDIRLWISENVVQAHGRFCKRRTSCV